MKMKLVPAIVGDKISNIETPALLLDLDQMETNQNRIQEMMIKYPGVALRPHAKAHKCPAIAIFQVMNGAVGICCQTVLEAQACVYGSAIKDVFISNQVVGNEKLNEMCRLAKHSIISVCVDNIGNIHQISAAAVKNEVVIACVVEVDVGQSRCGVHYSKVGELAAVITSLPGLSFKGIQCYQGWNQHIRNYSERKAAVDKVAEVAKCSVKVLHDMEIECKYVTGGGTGTFLFEAGSGIFTEVQPGSYILMDVDYTNNHSENAGSFFEFLPSLRVLSTVQSIKPGERAVIDAGLKAHSLDSGMPRILKPDGNTHLNFNNGGDNHGILVPSGNLDVGEMVQLQPGHCDPTAAMYDWIIGIRNDVVEQVWPILGRSTAVWTHPAVKLAIKY